MSSILCNFVAVYCEYKGGNKGILAEWLRHTTQNNLFKDGHLKKVRKQLQMIQNKYSTYPTFTYYPVFYMSYVLQIVGHIETGADMVNFAAEQIKPMPIRPAWERMSEACLMSNEDFLKLYNELIDDIVQRKIVKTYDWGHILAYISYWDAKGIKVFETRLMSSVQNSLNHIYEGIKTQEALMDMKRQFLQGCNALITDIEMPLLGEFLKSANEIYEIKLRKTKDSMSIVLENLSDDNCETLMNMDEAALPDHSTTYNSISIFNHVDINKVFKGLKSLSNKGRQDFNSFIRKRYMLSYNMGNWINETKEDVLPLTNLLTLVETEASLVEMMEQESYNRIAKSIQGAINRCNGNLETQ